MKTKKYIRRTIQIGALSGIFFLGSFAALKLENAPITKEMVGSAKQLIGIDINEAQADSILGSLSFYRSTYQALRRIDMPASTVPALIFNPVPVGFNFPDKVNSFLPGKALVTRLPANPDSLAFYSIMQLASLIKTKQISSLELTKFYIRRLKKFDDKLRFVVTFTEEHALKQAAKADAEIKQGHYKGLLHGIPFGAKDLLAQHEYPTTYGAPIYRERIIPIDAAVITKLENAGAILIAKTSMGELATGDIWFGGRTKNPWNISRGSSGSSAGSASAVSMGCLPFAIGSETQGSIINPAAECGVTGLRPSFGRVSKYGAMALSWSMDKLGPITRNAEDAAIVFNVIKGTDPRDLSTIAAPFNYNGDMKTLKGFRIGYIKADFDDKYDNHDNDSVTLATLQKLGATLVPIRYPDLPINEMGFILGIEAGAAFQNLVINKDVDKLTRQEKRNWAYTLRGAQFASAAEYINANRARTMLIQQWYEKLKGLDLYMSPCFTTNLTLSSLTGNPAIVVPNGKIGPKYRTSITFNGQLFGEGKMLEAANIYQAATRYHQQYPVEP
ncbi:Asp-tRNAAsn/Glu-tRNAGln amidotransferase A subunit [Mucilaginibacter pineti]|uniref:Asp-tRNAAsn/Glu-tRNAGln amidotransferase A subunit n=1 Tax=Mucilaginibacter pineti TaxID=1391627 RepID=A0A1G7EL15_9SPHI|nr:amidase [Mucilaginibacter pineti]SDE64106.1 Asp-tRNAAsn/Glu-tRNAGln amidotransferase A subunit [Mucilaginibacter pineti]